MAPPSEPSRDALFCRGPGAGPLGLLRLPFLTSSTSSPNISLTLIVTNAKSPSDTPPPPTPKLPNRPVNIRRAACNKMIIFQIARAPTLHSTPAPLRPIRIATQTARFNETTGGEKCDNIKRIVKPQQFAQSVSPPAPPWQCTAQFPACQARARPAAHSLLHQRKKRSRILLVSTSPILLLQHHNLLRLIHTRLAQSIVQQHQARPAPSPLAESAAPSSSPTNPPQRYRLRAQIQSQQRISTRRALPSLNPR